MSCFGLPAVPKPGGSYPFSSKSAHSTLPVGGTLTVTFWIRFFDQNPMSQLAVVGTRNGVAEKITTFTGTARKHTIEVTCEVTSSGTIPQYMCRR